MPHLSPISWLLIPIMLIMLLAMMMSMSFFMKSPKFPTMKLPITTSSLMMWKW